MKAKAFGIIFVAAALCLLFATGCKDTMGSKPIEEIEPPAPPEKGEIPSEEIEPGVWHDESCTCGGTLTFKKLSEGEFVVTCTGNHVLDGATGNEQWKSKFGFPMNALAEGPYLVSFEAKADLVHTTYLTIGDGSINLVDCAPLQLTTDYKKYNYVFFINANVLGKKNFEFNVLQGNLYVKNLTVKNMWAVETETSWEIWQDPSCTDLVSGGGNAGHIAIYEMTEDSVKAIRNTMDMKSPDSWKQHLQFIWDDKSAGKYRASFTNKSYSGDETENIVGNILVQYWDEVAQENIIISNVKGVSGHGKYYFYFDIPKKEEGKPFGLFFKPNTYGSWNQHFILEDVKVEKVTDETKIPDATRLESLRDGIVPVEHGWSIRYADWPYDDVTWSSVTEKGLTVLVPGDIINDLDFWAAEIIREPITLNPGETYFVSIDYISDTAMDLLLWNETDNRSIYVMFGDEMYYTNTSNLPKKYYLYIPIYPGYTHTITDFKEYVMKSTAISEGWSYKICGNNDALKINSVMEDGIKFTVSDDFDLCSVDLALDLEVGKDYTVECNITGPESQMYVTTTNYSTDDWTPDYGSFYNIYVDGETHTYDNIRLSDNEWNYTGECVLSFRPEVPGEYTISDIKITPVEY